MRFFIFPLWLLFVFLVSATAEPLQEPVTGNIEGKWNDLADQDAVKAYRAIWALKKTPKETVTQMEEKLKPVVAPDPRKVESLLDDLNSESFAVRDKANRELTKLDRLVESALKKKLEAKPSLETRQRIEKLLNRLTGPINLPDQIRQVRAVETLELIGSNAAKALLAKYAGGAPGARLTQEAKDALARLERAEPSTFEPSGLRSDLYGDALPSGAVGRLGTTRFRRNEAFFIGGGGLTFYPNGKALVTRGGEHDVQVWDFPSGRLLHEFSCSPLYIRGFAVAPDCKRLAVAGFYRGVANMAGPREIKVMELPNGNVIKTLSRTGGNGDSYQLAFSPDGKLLFSVDNREGILRVEEIDSGKELIQKKFPADNGGALELSRDGVYVALTSGPNTQKLFLWKWRDEEPRQLILPAQRIGRVAFSPDGKQLAAVEDYGNLFVWDVAGSRLLYRQEPGENAYFAGKPVFSPDGKTLAVPLRGNRNFRGKIEFFEPVTGRSQGILDAGSEIGSLAFTPDSQTLVVTAGCAVRFWNVATWQEITATGEAHESYASNIAVSSKGILATASDDGSVRLWDAATTKQRWKFTAEHWVRGLALSPDGNLVAASSLDDAVHVLDSRGGREIYRLAGHGQLGGRRTLGFFPDSKRLASWGDDYYLRVWDMKTGKARLEHPIRPKGIDFPDEEDDRRGRGKMEFDFSAATLSPDAKTLVLDISGHFHLFDTSTGKEKVMFASEGRLRDSLAISTNGKYLLASSYGDSQVGKHPVNLIDLGSGSALQRLSVPGTGSGRSAFAVDGRTFATTVDGPPGEIVLYETASGNVRATLRGFRGLVQSLTFFPDGRRLASAQSDSTVLIWDLTAPEHTKKGP
jgi:WD40 repeat protein